MPKVITQEQQFVKPVTKKVAKAAAPKEPAERKARGFNGLTQSKIKTLQELRDGMPKTRNDLVEATGIQKGWSKLLGAVTKDNFGGHADSLLALGYVKQLVAEEGVRGTRYQITATGRKALEKAEKEMAKAEAD